jgi:hypothetical protein
MNTICPIAVFVDSSARLVKDELAADGAERCYTEKVPSSLRSSTTREAVARECIPEAERLLSLRGHPRSMTWSPSSRQLDSSCGRGVRMT